MEELTVKWIRTEDLRAQNRVSRYLNTISGCAVMDEDKWAEVLTEHGTDDEGLLKGFEMLLEFGRFHRMTKENIDQMTKDELEGHDLSTFYGNIKALEDFVAGMGLELD